MLGARRTLSHASAFSVGMALGMDIHHTTLTHWEQKLRNACILYYQVWHRDRLREASIKPANAAGLGIRMCSIRADATNANIWNKCKLHVVENFTGFCRTRIRNSDHGCHFECWDHRIILADMAIARTSTWQGMLGLLEKQLESLGSYGSSMHGRFFL